MWPIWRNREAGLQTYRVTFYLTKTENRTKKSLAQLSHYFYQQILKKSKNKKQKKKQKQKTKQNKKKKTIIKFGYIEIEKQKFYQRERTI